MQSQARKYELEQRRQRSQEPGESRGPRLKPVPPQHSHSHVPGHLSSYLTNESRLQVPRRTACAERLIGDSVDTIKCGQGSEQRPLKRSRTADLAEQQRVSFSALRESTAVASSAHNTNSIYVIDPANASTITIHHHHFDSAVAARSSASLPRRTPAPTNDDQRPSSTPYGTLPTRQPAATKRFAAPPQTPKLVYSPPGHHHSQWDEQDSGLHLTSSTHNDSANYLSSPTHCVQSKRFVESRDPQMIADVDLESMTSSASSMDSGGFTGGAGGLSTWTTSRRVFEVPVVRRDWSSPPLPFVVDATTRTTSSRSLYRPNEHRCVRASSRRPSARDEVAQRDYMFSSLRRRPVREANESFQMWLPVYVRRGKHAGMTAAR